MMSDEFAWSVCERNRLLEEIVFQLFDREDPMWASVVP